jgi:hypothetical protein
MKKRELCHEKGAGGRELGHGLELVGGSWAMVERRELDH